MIHQFGPWRLDPAKDELLNTATGECKNLIPGCGRFLERLIQRSPWPVRNEEFGCDIPRIWKWAWDLRRKMGPAEYDRYIENTRGGYRFKPLEEREVPAAAPAAPAPPAAVQDATTATGRVPEAVAGPGASCDDARPGTWRATPLWLRDVASKIDRAPRLPGVDWSWLFFILVFPVFMLSAMAGGFVWSLFGGHLGPQIHGAAAIAWPIVSMLPCGAVVMAIHRYRYGETLWRDHAIFTLGLCAGSWLFYNVPLKQGEGLRVLLQGMPQFSREVAAVLIWAAVLIVGALLLALLRFPLVAVAIVLILVFAAALPVIAFLCVHPGPEYDTARGVVAGIALRTALSFGLLAGVTIRR